MRHLQPFCPRNVMSMPTVIERRWQLKRYAIFATDRDFDETAASAALVEAGRRLPIAGSLNEAAGNHGVGFQILHFAETAVMSPVFYWQWGSVLANVRQMRASWDTPTIFEDGAEEVVGCIWEMEVVNFELDAWRKTLLTDMGGPKDRLDEYISRTMTNT